MPQGWLVVRSLFPECLPASEAEMMTMAQKLQEPASRTQYAQSCKPQVQDLIRANINARNTAPGRSSPLAKHAGLLAMDLSEDEKEDDPKQERAAIRHDIQLISFNFVLPFNLL